MLEEEIIKLIRLRFDERNRLFVKKLTEIKQQMNSRGLLNSSITIKEAHEALEQEFKESALVIANSTIDSIKQSVDYSIEKTSVLAACQNILSARKSEVEKIFSSNTQSLRNDLLNSTMLDSFISLDQVYALNVEEMNIVLNKEMNSYLLHNNRTLFHDIKNRFFNRSVIAWGSIVILVVLILAEFSDAIRLLYENIKNLFG